MSVDKINKLLKQSQAILIKMNNEAMVRNDLLRIGVRKSDPEFLKSIIKEGELREKRREIFNQIAVEYNKED